MKLTTNIYLTRHGQTMWNVEGRMQGWKDSNLTELGINQAKWLRDRLDNINIDIIYSSSSGRAYNTAEILNQRKNLKIIKDDRLRELKLGDFQGLTQDEIKDTYSKEYYKYYNEPHLFKPLGDGETFNELYIRACNTIDDIVRKNEGKNILVVTHTMIIKAIICRINNISIDEFWDRPYIKQTSLTTIEWENSKYKITQCADISHHEYLMKEFNE